MPVPASINDLSTTAGSNYPQGTDTPGTGDDTIRALSSFIAGLRDQLNGTIDAGTLKNPIFTGSPTGLRAPLVASKSATTSRTTTTLSDDPHLIVALSTGVWSLNGFLSFYGSTTGTQSIKIRPEFSGTATTWTTNLSGFVNGSFNAGNAAVYAMPQTFLMPNPITTASGAQDYMQISGVIVVTVAGNFSIQWAQQSSSSNATNLTVGSWISCLKVS